MPEKLTPLPPSANLESIAILKKVNLSNKALAELKGVARTIPNSAILINTLSLQEAKDSSAIENIITTHEDLYKSDIDLKETTQSAKEVKNYSTALKKGFELVSQNKILITRYMIEIQEILENNKAGIRKQTGTVLKNPATGEVIYTPPQNYGEIMELLKNLEEYIHQKDSVDPLIKMAVIHYQFESIHPFYDGNGRTGRILNVLYLVLNGLLDFPVLSLSRYIIRHKKDYYRLLQEVRTENKWEEWILYILEGIENTAYETIQLIEKIKNLMEQTQEKIKRSLPKLFSKDLLETLFLHPYTKIEFLVDYLDLHRETASIYLKKLEEIKILEGVKFGRSKYYINRDLFDLLKNT